MTLEFVDITSSHALCELIVSALVASTSLLISIDEWDTLLILINFTYLLKIIFDSENLLDEFNVLFRGHWECLWNLASILW